MKRESQKDSINKAGLIFFEPLDVAVLDLLHEGFAHEDIALEISDELRGTTKN